MKTKYNVWIQVEKYNTKTDKYTDVTEKIVPLDVNIKLGEFKTPKAALFFIKGIVAMVELYKMGVESVNRKRQSRSTN